MLFGLPLGVHGRLTGLAPPRHTWATVSPARRPLRLLGCLPVCLPACTADARYPLRIPPRRSRVVKEQEDEEE
jgi:hypothetical protein